MAFPTVVGTAGKATFATNVTSCPVPYPTGVSGGIQAGDILLVVGAIDTQTNSVSNWNGFTPLRELAGGGSATMNVCGYKRAAGGESGSITFTITTAEHSSWVMVCIRGAHATTAPEASTGAAANTGNADPDAVTPSWGAEDTLFVACAGVDGASVPTGAPADYTGLETQTGDASGGSVGLAVRQLNATSDDPGTFTNTSDNWSAWTVAVRPAAGAQTVSASAALTATTTVTAAGRDVTSRAAAALTAESLVAANGREIVASAAAGVTAATAVTADGAKVTTGLPANWNAEGGTDAANVTVGNSGGASGTAFTGVTDTGSIITYSTAAAAHGSLGLAVTEPASSSIASVEWDSTIVGSQTHVYGRLYLKFSANPNINVRIMRFYNGATLACGLTLATSGGLSWMGGANGDTFLTGGSAALTAGTLYRVEFDIVFGGSGNLRGYVYAGDGTSTVTTLTSLGQSTGGQTSANKMQFGALISGLTSKTLSFDDVNLNTTGLPGPATGAATVSRGAALTAQSAVTATHSRDLARTTAATAATAIAVASQRTLQRAASASAASVVTASGIVAGRVERSAAVNATGVVQANASRTLQRAATVAATTTVSAAANRATMRSATATATTAIAVSGAKVTVAFMPRVTWLALELPARTGGPSTISRSAAVTAATAIQAAAQRTLQRQSSLAAATTVTASGVVQPHGVVERSASVTAAGAVTVTARRLTHARSATVAAASNVTATGDIAGRVERSAAITTASAVTTAALRVNARAVQLTAATSITAAGLKARGRTAQLTAATAITAAGGRVATRSVQLTAAGQITTKGLRVHQRATVLQAASSITATGDIAGKAIRSAAVTATAAITASGRITTTRRAAAVTATTAVAATGRHVLARSAAITATTTIATRGITIGQPPALETHPALSGSFDETSTCGTYDAASTGGRVLESARGGIVG